MMNVWPLLMIFGALLMRAGLSLYSVGLERSKNAGSTMGRQMLDWAIAVLAFWAIGSAIAFQNSTPYLGIDWRRLLGGQIYDINHVDGMVYGFSFVTLVGAVLVGATAGRSRLGPIMILSFVTAGFTLPIAMNWINSGWLYRLGYVDVAGASFVHVLGAAVALAAVRAVGSREGKYHRDGSASVFPGHHLTGTMGGAMLAVPGAILLIVTAEFLGYTNGIGPINVLLAASASTVAAAVYCQLRFSKIDLSILTASLLGGLIAISASPSTYAGYAAVIIGGVAGVLVPIAMIRLDLMLKVDDVTGGIAIHGVAGIWGILAAGIFTQTRNEEKYHWAAHGHQILIQLAGLAAIGALAYAISAVTLFVLSKVTTLRVSENEEFDGLDLSEHDVAAYPDFQQITIKSHHLREV